MHSLLLTTCTLFVAVVSIKLRFYIANQPGCVDEQMKCTLQSLHLMQLSSIDLYLSRSEMCRNKMNRTVKVVQIFTKYQ